MNLSQSGISRKILWIAVLALVARLSFIALNPRPLYSDELDYQKLAVTLSTEHRYALDTVPTAYRPVGYPAFVAVVYLLAGVNPAIVKIVQAILDSMIVLLLPLLIPDSPERTKVLVALFWSFFPPAILFANLLMTETLYTTLCVALAVLYVSGREDRVGSQILLGIDCGLLALLKPASGIFCLAIVLYEWLFRKSAKSAVVIGISCVLVVLPWAARNWSVIGEPAISTSSGMNLLIGNNPNANGSYTAKFDFPELTEAPGEAMKDGMAFRLATGYIFSHPGLFAANGVKKFAHLFSTESFLIVSQFSRSSGDIEMPLAKKYATVSPFLSFAVNIPYFTLLILGWLGFLTNGENRLTHLFALFLGSLVLVHLITFGGNRFHFPLMPFCGLFASVFMTSTRLKTLLAMTRMKQLCIVLPVMAVISVWIVELVLLTRA